MIFSRLPCTDGLAGAGIGSNLIMRKRPLGIFRHEFAV